MKKKELENARSEEGEGEEGEGVKVVTKELVFEEPEMYPIEKNWMRFQVADGTPHFIRSIDPYMIVRDSGKANLRVI